MSNILPKINLFVSYSHDDEPYFKEFSSGLKKVVKNSQNYEWKIWDDTNIHVGTFWDDEIQNNIQGCNIALLLVSVGFMSSKYIKEKEYNEFIKRYANKGILVVPIVFCPCEFTQWDDLGKLQFFKPNGSTYGKAEIKDFTYADLIEFRKTDGILIPNPNINRYHLDLVKKIESSYEVFLVNKSDIIDSIERNEKSKPINKLSDYPKIGNLFTGRKNELQRFKEIFDSSRMFAIEGLGGVGKTQFTSKCIEECIDDKNKIIWLNGSAQSNFDVFVESAGYGDVLMGEKKTDLVLYSGLKDLIEKDERIIFLDNFNDYEDTSFSKFLSFSYPYLQKATIILITKVDPSIDGVTSLPIIRVEGLDEDAIEYAKKLKKANSRYSLVKDEDLIKICSTVEGHPLAIEFSMWLLGYGKSLNDIILHMPEYSGMKKVEEFSKRLFLDIFNHQKTSNEERNCFLMCSVFKEKITECEISYLYDGKNVFHLLTGLIDKLLITPKEGYYEIHPLVRSFSYEKLENKKDIHKKAANYFITQRRENLDLSLEEKIFYHLLEAQEFQVLGEFIEINGRQFIRLGQVGLINEQINRIIQSGISRPIFDILLGDISQIKGEWQIALLHYKKAIESNNIIIKTEGIVKYGEMLYRRGDIKESLPHFENAYKFASDNCLSKEESRALNDIGLVYRNFGKYDVAIENFNKSLKIRTEIKDMEGIATSYLNLASMFIFSKKFDKALDYYQRSLEISTNIGDKFGIALSFSHMASLYIKQNLLEKALVEINLALDLYKELGDKLGVCNCINTIGVIYADQKKTEESFYNYQESLKIRKEIGDKIGISAGLSNIGTYYFDKENYKLALGYFFESYSITKQMGSVVEGKQTINWINSISEKIGKEKFRELAIDVHESMDEEMQKLINITEIFNEPLVRESPKVGRNDPCPCGNGKKYKKCHGMNL